MRRTVMERVEASAQQEQPAGRHGSARVWAPHVALVGIYLLLAWWAGSLFALEEPPLPLVWPATGVGLAFVYRYGYSLLVPLVVVAVAVQLVMGAELAGALLMAAGQAGGAAIGAWLLMRCRFRADFSQLRDVMVFLGVGAGVSAGVSAMAGTLAITGLDTGFPEVLGLCWAADLMGVVLFTPLLLAWPRVLSAGRWRARDGEAAGWVVLAPVLAFGIYGAGLPDVVAMPLSYAVFPVVIATALRHRVHVAAAAVAAAAMVALMCTAAGKGPFAGAGLPYDLLSLHAQLALLALTALVIAAVRQERIAAEARAREHLHALNRAGRLNAAGTLAGSLAHELNQPLCALSSYARAARRQMQQGAPADEVAPTLDRIAEGADRAASIVRRTRSMLAREPAAGGPVDAAAAVREALALLQPEAVRQGVELRLDGPGTRLPPLWMDAVELQQVVINLVQNGIAAAAAEGGEPRVRVALGPADHGAVELVITDTGPGLPPGAVEDLFQPLVSHRDGGTGLGLAITRSIVEGHGGTIVADNAPGAGARFRVCLPCGADPAGPGEAGDGYA
ncbi:ATP-binding protein [Thioalkalivibrio sp. ALE11]|uniref:ATP-binding protein n=1 Tax=Thioalkalivibrio sp. ALE11 TaxID=1265494 RepID=UPI0018CBC1FE|nr:ATP-binding protein [Thioalkalivibrio sp. ALE11]